MWSDSHQFLERLKGKEVRVIVDQVGQPEYVGTIRQVYGDAIELQSSERLVLLNWLHIVAVWEIKK